MIYILIFSSFPQYHHVISLLRYIYISIDHLYLYYYNCKFLSYVIFLNHLLPLDTICHIVEHSCPIGFYVFPDLIMNSKLDNF